MDVIIAFIYSLGAYTCFQFLDMWSTKVALSQLNLEKHEVNPVLVSLKKRFGINRSLFLMWLVIANSVALIDALIVQEILGFPLLCFFFGMFHVLAVFNNLQIHFEKKLVGVEIFEQNTEFLIQELKKQSLLGKIAMLFRLNLFNIFVSAFGVFALYLSVQLLSVLQISIPGQTSIFLLYFPPLMILVLIMFFPMKVFGMFIVIGRRLSKSKSESPADIKPQEASEPTVSIPVSVLESALQNAKANNAMYVQFCLTQKES
jgi:hypothetical protein